MHLDGRFVSTKILCRSSEVGYEKNNCLLSHQLLLFYHALERTALDTANGANNPSVIFQGSMALLFWTDKGSLYFDNNDVFRIGMIFSMLYFQRKVMSSGHTTGNLE